MSTAEMRDLPQASSSKSPDLSATPTPAPELLASGWMKAGVWCLAAVSLGASLVYTGREEHRPAEAYALDRDWSMASPLGVAPASEPAPALVGPEPTTCAICGEVEAVAPLPPAERTAGRKRMFQVKVRMADGHTRTVQVVKPPAVGTPVTLERGVLRVAQA